MSRSAAAIAVYATYSVVNNKHHTRPGTPGVAYADYACSQKNAQKILASPTYGVYSMTQTTTYVVVQ